MDHKIKQELLQAWRAEEQHPFEGWDFSHLQDRMIEAQPPWVYAELARTELHQSTAMLDLGTAEGKRLLELKEDWPKKVAVTEEYQPNFLLAQANLVPLGVGVHNVRLTHTDPMPFGDGEFDLILNRHSAFNSNEVGRILTKGGVFLTQQVHGLDLEDLMGWFGTAPNWPDSNPENYVVRLDNAGLILDTVHDWQGTLT
ncbi:MAG: ubiquinone biosynthesis protein, partial [Chloroflexota bacterium]